MCIIILKRKSRMKIFITSAFAVFILFTATSCRLSDAYAMKREAEAYSIQTQAEQKVLNQEVERRRIEAQNKYDKERLEAIAAEIDAAWKEIIRYVVLVSIICVVAIGVSIAVSFKNYSTGMVGAKVKHANLLAETITIMPDPITGLFPLFYSRTKQGRMTIYNANTEAVYYLDTHNPADQEAIRGMGRMLCVYADKFQTAKSDKELGKMETIKNLLLDKN
jgi:hypothetical protein